MNCCSRETIEQEKGDYKGYVTVMGNSFIALDQFQHAQ